MWAVTECHYIAQDYNLRKDHLLFFFLLVVEFVCFVFICICMCVHVNVYHVCDCAQGGLRRVSDPLELEFQVAVSH